MAHWRTRSDSGRGDAFDATTHRVLLAIAGMALLAILVISFAF